MSKSIISTLGSIYDLLNSPKAVRSIAALATLASLFGIVAPETATGIRDAVLSLAF